MSKNTSSSTDILEPQGRNGQHDREGQNFMGTSEIVGGIVCCIGVILYFIDFDLDLDVDLPGISGFDAVGFTACFCLIAGFLLMLEDWRWELGASLGAAALAGARGIVRYRTINFDNHPAPAEQVTGQVGYTKTELEPRGLVQMRGEMWSAESDNGQHIDQDTKVMVLEVEGNTLMVFRDEGTTKE